MCSTGGWAGTTRTSRGAPWRRCSPDGVPAVRTVRSLTGGPEVDGGDSPAWSRKRDRYQPPPLTDPGVRVPYAELHCHSNFSFLDGASPPEELVEQAKRLGLRGAGAHRPRRHVRRGPLRRGRGRAGRRHGVRHRALAGPFRSAERRGRPGGHPPAAAGPRSRGLPRALPHGAAPPRCAAGRRAARSTTSTSWSRTPRATCWCSPAAAKARCARPWTTLRAAASPRGRCGGCVERFGADNVAVELTDAGLPTDTERAPRWPISRPTPGCPRWPPPPRTTPPPTASGWPRRWRRCGRGAASTTPTAGCRRRPPRTCGPAQMLERFEHQPPGGGGARGGDRARVRVLDPAGGARAAAVRRCRRGPPRRRWLRELTWRGVARRYGSHAEYPEAPTRGAAHELAIIEQRGFPRLLPHRPRHRGVLPARRHPLPGPGLGRELRGVLRAGHHQRRRGARWACCSSGSCPRRATAIPTSTSTSSPTGARR